MRNNPRDWRVEDLKVVADKLGIDHDQSGTSHVVFRHHKAGRLSVPVRRPVKPVYSRLFLELIGRVDGQNED
jgi:hypothetical protein